MKTVTSQRYSSINSTVHSQVSKLTRHRNTYYRNFSCSPFGCSMENVSSSLHIGTVRLLTSVLNADDCRFVWRKQHRQFGDNLSSTDAINLKEFYFLLWYTLSKQENRSFTTAEVNRRHHCCLQGNTPMTATSSHRASNVWWRHCGTFASRRGLRTSAPSWVAPPGRHSSECSSYIHVTHYRTRRPAFSQHDSMNPRTTSGRWVPSVYLSPCRLLVGRRALAITD